LGSLKADWTRGAHRLTAHRHSLNLRVRSRGLIRGLITVINLRKVLHAG